MNGRRLLVVGLGGVLAIAVGVYGTFAYSMLDEEPSYLLACMDVEEQWQAWTCEQALRRAALTSERIEELNAQAGALFPTLLEDDEKAEAMLTLFLDRGVDINAGHELAKGWTALHTVASDGNMEKARLLIRHGARTDVRDDDGRTPLDVARALQSKFPDNARYAEMARFLAAQNTGDP